MSKINKSSGKVQEAGAPPARSSCKEAEASYEAEFVRAANEDDDGYDPWSDRPPEREPLFEENPWS